MPPETSDFPRSMIAVFRDAALIPAVISSLIGFGPAVRDDERLLCNEPQIWLTPLADLAKETV